MTISEFLPAKEIQPEVTSKFFTYTRTLQKGGLARIIHNRREVNPLD